MSVQLLYAAQGGPNTDSFLYIIDPTTATVISTSPSLIGNGITGLAQNPITGVLYGVTSSQAGNANPNTLVSIDTTTGIGTPIGTGLGAAINDITFLSDGSAYGWGFDVGSGTGNLYSIDINTGVATLIGPGVLPSLGGGISADPANDTMYVSRTVRTVVDDLLLETVTPGGVLTTVNPITGPSILGGSRVSAYSFNNASALYGALQTTFGAGPTELIIVDTTTGVETTVGTFNIASVPLPNVDAIAFFVAICIHSSSSIEMAEGPERPISSLWAGDIVKDAEGKDTKLVHALPCWLKLPADEKYHECIIFEPDSLGLGLPKTRLAIDPGHHMCHPLEYKHFGDRALKPARAFYQALIKRLGERASEFVQLTTWDHAAELLPGGNRRYDLVLDSDSCGAYVANGVVIKGRKSRDEAGYKHWE